MKALIVLWVSILVANAAPQWMGTRRPDDRPARD